MKTGQQSSVSSRQSTGKGGLSLFTDRAKRSRRIGTVPGFIIFLFVFSLLTSQLSLVVAAEKWPGVDESVIEKIAKEHGREAREPLINTDQGDLLLFVFLIAGAVGGFGAGYCWRMLTERNTKTIQDKGTENTTHGDASAL